MILIINLANKSSTLHSAKVHIYIRYKTLSRSNLND